VTKRTKSTSILLLPVVLAGCTVWIDDFAVAPSEDGGAASQEGPGADADGDADGDTDDQGGEPGQEGTGPVVDTGIACGEMVETPTGRTLEFCTVKAGAFFMGCDESAEGECQSDELPRREVSLGAYLIQKLEVSVAEFAAFATDQPDWQRGGALAAQRCGSNYLSRWNGATPPGGTDPLPVVDVCWHAADAFCRWLGEGFALPSEAEWERAARGRHDGGPNRDYWTYPFGDTPSCDKANYKDCNTNVIAVGATTGLSFGELYDMAGNAWEWVADWYRADYYCDPTGAGGYAVPQCDTGFNWQAPKGDADGVDKVLRGGSWYHTPDMLRSAKREHLGPSETSNLAGFRCAGH
jgi:formylglycine-generating enzyme required for sulfatase activity